MKAKIIFASIAFALACSAQAQVSCSPAVNPVMCKDAAVFFNGAIRLPIEIVAPLEYKNRLVDFDKLEEAMSSDPDKDKGKSAADVEHFTVFHKHVLYQTYTDDISFLRDKPSDRRPSRILVSSEFFEFKDFKTVDGKVTSVSTGKYDSTSLGQFFSFASGYIQGTMATSADGGYRMDQLIKVIDRDKANATRNQ